MTFIEEVKGKEPIKQQAPASKAAPVKQQTKSVVSDDFAKAFGAGGTSWGDLPPIVVEQPKPTPAPEVAAKTTEDTKVETPVPPKPEPE